MRAVEGASEKVLVSRRREGVLTMNGMVWGGGGC